MDHPFSFEGPALKQKRGNPQITPAGLTAAFAVLTQMQAKKLDPEGAPEPDLRLLLVDASHPRGHILKVALGRDCFGPFVEVTVRKPGPGNTGTITINVDPQAFLATRFLLAPGEALFLNSAHGKTVPLADHRFYLRCIVGLNFPVLRLVAGPSTHQEVEEAPHNWRDYRRGWLDFKQPTTETGRMTRARDLLTRKEAIRFVCAKIATRKLKGAYRLAVGPEELERAFWAAVWLLEDAVPLGSYRQPAQAEAAE